jgi:hypothetical protein
MTNAVNIAQSGSNNQTMRNRIINGAMVIDQRNAGASVTIPAGGAYVVDRYDIYCTQASKLTGQQNAGSVTPPPGFTNYSGLTSTSAYSVLASDIFSFFQNIEGYNVADLGWGTANAQPVTLSFWVRSSLTGSFGGACLNGAQNRNYPFSYTISAANTWEFKTVTIPGDTTGTWLTTNGRGLILCLGLGNGTTFSGTAGAWAAGQIYAPTGSVSVVGTNGATWYITGVQLEEGTAASPFENRLYGTELALCQRYGLLVSQAQNSGDVCGSAANTNVKFQFPVTMRTSPTASLVTAGSWIVGNGYSANYTASSVSIAGQATSPQGGRVALGGFPTFGSNFFVSGTDATGTAVMFMSAEL